MKNLITITCLLLLAASTTAQFTWPDTLGYIRVVETGGMPNEGVGAMGDGGKAFGPYQIWKPYWQDSSIKGSHALCLNSKAYSEKVVRGYMLRYAPRELGRLVAGKGSMSDLEKVARIHNGGPKGYKKKATIKYWAKIKRLIP